MKLLRRIRGLFGPSPKFTGGKLPTRGSGESAGLDLYVNKSISIPPGATKLVETGLKCDFLPGWAALLWDRSGLGFKGIHRYAGVIDSDYRGEWGVVIHNGTYDTITLNQGDRVAQVLFQRVWCRTPRVGKLTKSARGSKGFGSTGS